MRTFHEAFVVVDVAVSGGVLDESAKDLVVEFKGVVVADDDGDAEGSGAGLDDVNGLGMALD